MEQPERPARPLRVRRAAVIGAGVMGSQIAGWLASLGIPCELLDLASSAPDRNRLADQGLRRLFQMRPPPLTTQDAARRIRTGNVEDHKERLAGVDLVIEAVVEELGAKQALWADLEGWIGPHAVIATNTSGLSVTEQARGRGESFRRHFMGIHFFNPPRYMRLVEVIPTADTDPDLVRSVVEWLRRILGKAPVLARDTPNFIGNRIGIYALQTVLSAMQRFHLSVEAVDLITGPVMGRPKSATFRTLDLVGLDTYLHVLRTGASRAADPEERALLSPPPVIEEMVRRGLLGEKSGAGFYRRQPRDGSSVIEVLDWETMEYRPRQEVRFESVDRAMAAPPSRRLEVLLEGDDEAARFAWAVLEPTLLFCAAKLDEIAYSAADVDRALRYGFSWDQGPFEVWDRLGVRRLAERMESHGISLPPLVQRVRQADPPAFYRTATGPGGAVRREAVDGSGAYAPVQVPSDHLSAQQLREAGAVVWTGPSATLFDLGQDVAGLEFHAPKAAIDDAFIESLEKALHELGERFRGLVVFSDGPDFSVGANLFQVLVAARQGAWDQLEAAVRRFQSVNMAMKYARAPVAVAVNGRVLGGGVEMMMHAPAAMAAVESYIGLVETGVGLIPAGGGTKEMVLRTLARLPEGRALDVQGLVAWMFEVIAQATVATSAHHARLLGYLRPEDEIVADRDALLFRARRRVAYMDEAGWQPPAPATISAPGRDIKAALVAGVLDMRRANRITDYEVTIGKQLAHVVCGGDVPGGTALSEWAYLDLEREAFLKLLGQEKTQKRIEHVLTTGRPLRN
ncbi:MAG: 3-hydroxyacyl-CoA dehydrogenase/enoyl-CoA hydratase family protein [Bacillota bacterium]